MQGAKPRGFDTRRLSFDYTGRWPMTDHIIPALCFAIFTALAIFTGILGVRQALPR
jgi:hypothetical protein